QFLVSFGLSAALRADLSSLCPSDCRPRFARTSVPCVLRTVGRASRGPQFLVSFGLSSTLRADLSSLCPSDCRPRFARTSVATRDAGLGGTRARAIRSRAVVSASIPLALVALKPHARARRANARVAW